MHDIQRERGLNASADRKKHFDKKSVRRELTVGELVLVRQPGMFARTIRDSVKEELHELSSCSKQEEKSATC